VVLDADIKGFFDNLSHRVIMAAVAAEVADGNILNLVLKQASSPRRILGFSENTRNPP
jgi:retron-type reverse transcriptase